MSKFLMQVSFTREAPEGLPKKAVPSAVKRSSSSSVPLVANWKYYISHLAILTFMRLPTSLTT
jgi:hypothetical protein